MKILKLKFDKDLCKSLWYELNPRVRCAFGNVYICSPCIVYYIKKNEHISRCLKIKTVSPNDCKLYWCLRRITNPKKWRRKPSSSIIAKCAWCLAAQVQCYRRALLAIQGKWLYKAFSAKLFGSSALSLLYCN